VAFFDLQFFETVETGDEQSMKDLPGCKAKTQDRIGAVTKRERAKKSQKEPKRAKQHLVIQTGRDDI
jgi:hypothetical protein